MTAPDPRSAEAAPESPSPFTRRVLIATGVILLVAVLVYFVSLLTDILLLTFAAIVLAVAVDGITRFIGRYLPLSRMWALLLAFALILLLATGAGFVIVPQAAEELPRIVQQVPQAVEQLGTILGQLPGAEGDNGNNALFGADMLAQIGGMFATAFSAVFAVAVIILFAVYLVISPGQYIGQVLRLFPPGRRERLAHMVEVQGHALRLWLLSRLVSMVFVGVTAGVGLALLGVPMAFTLGLLSGLLTFIPYLGPILAAIPTALVALLEGPELALYAVLLYFAIEMVEAYLVFPLVAKGVVHLPPAYTVIVQLGGGAVAGLPGVILATPLAVAAAVAVQMLYIEDVLGEPVEVLGEG